MTPIFSRIWFVKMQQVRAFEMSEVNLRRAALINRACAPTVTSPISPSSSAFVTSAATESSTITSSALERFNDTERFLARTRLRHEQIVKIDPQLSGVCRIKRVFDVDEGSESAALLRLRDHSESQRRFAGGFRTENFDHATTWKAAHAQRAIDQNVARGNDIDIDNLVVAQAHDRAVAVILGDLLDGEIEILVSRRSYFAFVSFGFGLGCHRGGL